MAAWRGVEPAAACATCPQRDRRVLVRRRVAGAWVTCCANCAAILGRRALSLEALRAEIVQAA